jgi:hypothetical protein
MDTHKRKQNPGMVCTCNNLYYDDLMGSIKAGWDNTEDIMFDHDTQLRCNDCKFIIDAMINKHNKPA